MATLHEDIQGIYSSRDSKQAFQDYKLPGRGIFFCPQNEIHKRLKPFLIENLRELKPRGF